MGAGTARCAGDSRGFVRRILACQPRTSKKASTFEPRRSVAPRVNSWVGEMVRAHHDVQPSRRSWSESPASAASFSTVYSAQPASLDDAARSRTGELRARRVGAALRALPTRRSMCLTIARATACGGYVRERVSSKPREVIDAFHSLARRFVSRSRCSTGCGGIATIRGG